MDPAVPRLHGRRAPGRPARTARPGPAGPAGRALRSASVAGRPPRQRLVRPAGGGGGAAGRAGRSWALATRPDDDVTSHEGVSVFEVRMCAGMPTVGRRCGTPRARRRFRALRGHAGGRGRQERGDEQQQ